MGPMITMYLEREEDEYLLAIFGTEEDPPRVARVSCNGQPWAKQLTASERAYAEKQLARESEHIARSPDGNVREWEPDEVWDISEDRS